MGTGGGGRAGGARRGEHEDREGQRGENERGEELRGEGGAGEGDRELEWERRGEGHAVKALAFSPDGTMLAVAAGSGVGHIWLYMTGDWSCQRMEGGLLRPPVACCFCDWPDLTQPPQLFVAPGPSSVMQCLPVPGVSQGFMKLEEAPVPPYLHYHDAADEEESCPQPSALPPALAAFQPHVAHTANDAFPRFRSHPPLPPHPLSKLSLQHRSEANGDNSPGAVDSDLRWAGNSPGNVTAERCTRAVETSPGHAASGAGKATDADKSPSALRADSGTSTPSGSSHCGSHLPNSAEPQQYSTLDGLPDQQQLHSHSAIQKRQQQPSAQQDGSQSEWESSDACGDESDLAVGDDELLEHEADTLLPQSAPLHHTIAQQTVLQSARGSSQHDLASGQMPSAQQQHQHRFQQDDALTQRHCAKRTRRSRCDDQVQKQSQQQAQQQQVALQQEGSEPVSCYEQPSMQAVSHVLPAATLPTKMKVPKQLFVRPLASAEALVEQPAYPSRTPAGQFWTAGGQHPREPLTQIQQAAGPPASALAQPQVNSTALLAAKIDKLQGAEFDTAAVQQDPEVQRRVTSAAAVAANVPHDAVLFHDLQPLNEVAVPVEAPKIVQKQLHPAWVAKRHLKPELSDLWTAEERHKPIITTAVSRSHVCAAPAGKFFWFLLFKLLTLTYFTFFGMLADALTPTLQLAAVCSADLSSMFNLFAGMTQPNMPGWW
ncbi:hypothetical protein WJX77_003543 [Trebouxia sp. C0004]